MPEHARREDADRVGAAHQPASARSTPPVGNRALRSLLATPAVRRLPLTEEQWKHIAKGEVRKDKVVGYHWTGARDAVAEKAAPGTAPDARGVYEAPVQSTKKKDGKPVATKDKASSFWPDAWSEAKIRKAIEKAGTARNNVSEVLDASDPDIHGMRIFVNPESRFPVYEPPVDEDDRKKGGRKKR